MSVPIPQMTKLSPYINANGSSSSGQLSTQSTKGDNADPNFNAEFEIGLDESDFGLDSKHNREILFGMYTNEAVAHDTAMLKDLNDSLDVLIIMAGLFATILTAFLMGSFQLLQTNPQDTTNNLLSAILNRLELEGQLNRTDTQAQSIFEPAFSSILINILLFSSLICSLFAAFIAMLAKQWLQAYISDRPGRLEVHARQRQLRHEGFKSWKVPEIISTLPFLMQFAFVLFFIGLDIWLLTVNTIIGSLISSGTVILLIFYIITTGAPFFDLACPFKTPFTLILRMQMRWILYNLKISFHYIRSLLDSLRFWREFPPFPWLGPVITNAEIETKHLEETQNKLDIGMIQWLVQNSHDQIVLHTSLKAIGELRPNSSITKRYRDNGVIQRLFEHLEAQFPVSLLKEQRNKGHLTVQATELFRNQTAACTPYLASVFCCLRFCSINDISPIRYLFRWRTWIILWNNLTLQQLFDAGWNPDALALYLASTSQCDRAEGRRANRCFTDMVELLNWHSSGKRRLSDYSQWALMDSIAQWGAQLPSDSMLAVRRSVISSLLKLFNSSDAVDDSITSVMGLALGVFALGFQEDKILFYQDEERRRRDSQTLLMRGLTEILKDKPTVYNLTREDLEAAGLATCKLFMECNAYYPSSLCPVDALIVILTSTSLEDVACRILDTFRYLLSLDSQSGSPNLLMAIHTFLLSAKSEPIKIKATQVITEMAQWKIHKKAILEHGLIGSLVDNLKSSCEELANASSTALMVFARDNEVRLAMVQQNLMEGLTAFFDSGAANQNTLAHWSLLFSTLDWKLTVSGQEGVLGCALHPLHRFIESGGGIHSIDGTLSPSRRRALQRSFENLIKNGQVKNELMDSKCFK